MTQVAIRAQDLRFQWSEEPSGEALFDNLSFDLAGGSFTALTGPSGCGKTSLLRLLAGFARPQSGTLSAPAEHIGYVFQEAALMEWKTVFDNVALPFHLSGGHKNLAKEVAQALADVGLTEAAALYPRQLSGGMKMRVALARALITRPALLLMDEPFAALDEPTREQLENDLHQLWRAQACTIVLVTHTLSESVFLAEQVMVMSKARKGILKIHKIDAPMPRPANFRDSAAFQTHRVALRHLLLQASEGETTKKNGAAKKTRGGAKT